MSSIIFVNPDQIDPSANDLLDDNSRKMPTSNSPTQNMFGSMVNDDGMECFLGIESFCFQIVFWLFHLLNVLFTTFSYGRQTTSQEKTHHAELYGYEH